MEEKRPWRRRTDFPVVRQQNGQAKLQLTITKKDKRVPITLNLGDGEIGFLMPCCEVCAQPTKGLCPYKKRDRPIECTLG